MSYILYYLIASTFCFTYDYDAYHEYEAIKEDNAEEIGIVVYDYEDHEPCLTVVTTRHSELCYRKDGRKTLTYFSDDL